MQEYVVLGIVREIHIVAYLAPAGCLRLVIEAPLLLYATIVIRTLRAHTFGRFGGITHAPTGYVESVPVVVDIVLVLVGPRDAEHDVLAFRRGEIDALRPETGYGYQHLETVTGYIIAIAGVTHVVVYGVCDGSVTMYLLESYLPLVVTFAPVHRHHRIECGSAVETELTGVLYGRVELVVTVEKQIAGHLPPCRRHIERQAIGLGVPIGAAAVFLAGETLRTHIEPTVAPGICLQQLEDAIANALLGLVVALYLYVGVIPYGGPTGFMFL